MHKSHYLGKSRLSAYPTINLRAWLLWLQSNSAILRCIQNIHRPTKHVRDCGQAATPKKLRISIAVRSIAVLKPTTELLCRKKNTHRTFPYIL